MLISMVVVSLKTLKSPCKLRGDESCIYTVAAGDATTEAVEMENTVLEMSLSC